MRREGFTEEEDAIDALREEVAELSSASAWDFWIDPIESASEIPAGWSDCFPWFADGTRTVHQLLEERE